MLEKRLKKKQLEGSNELAQRGRRESWRQVDVQVEELHAPQHSRRLRITADLLERRPLASFNIDEQYLGRAVGLWVGR